MSSAGKQGPLAQIAMRGDKRAGFVQQVLGQYGNSRRHADLGLDVVSQRHGLGKSGSPTEQLRPDKAVREPVKRKVREERVLVELGLHVSMAIAPVAAAKEYPRRLAHGAVVHGPGEGLRVEGIDQDMNEGLWASVLPFERCAFFGGEIGWVAGVMGHPRQNGEAQMDADD